MLHTQQIADALEAQRERLTGYQDAHQQRLEVFRRALAGLAARYPSANALRAALAQRTSADAQGAPPPAGAYPTGEWDTWVARGITVPASDPNQPALPALRFEQTFAHHGEAREWAERLAGVTTFAVDGSQIPPWRDASIPVALVQVALFENPHQPPAPYVKDVAAELLVPDDLIPRVPDTADARTGQVLTYSTQLVHLRRFELEARTVIERMRYHARLREQGGAAAQRQVVAFYDGSLIVSFALALAREQRERYVAASRQMLAASAQTRIPLVGYIDTSYARDMVTLLSAQEREYGERGEREGGGGFAENGERRKREEREASAKVESDRGKAPRTRTIRAADDGEMGTGTRGVHDALLWHGALGWGDRTPAFISARGDLEQLGYETQAEDVAFVYFQAATDRPPARLELPRWVVDEGLLDTVMDVVRAETIAGTGYPYPIETADAAAVITAADRAQFYALFQQFAEHAGIGFSFSRKALSKSRRRV